MNSQAVMMSHLCMWESRSWHIYCALNSECSAHAPVMLLVAKHATIPQTVHVYFIFRYLFYLQVSFIINLLVGKSDKMEFTTPLFRFLKFCIYDPDLFQPFHSDLTKWYSCMVKYLYHAMVKRAADSCSHRDCRTIDQKIPVCNNIHVPTCYFT